MYSNSGKSSIKKTKPKTNGGGFGDERQSDTQWPCNCTDSNGAPDGFADLSVGASSVNQANRRCEKRGEQQGRNCSAWFGGGGTNIEKELGGGNGNTVSDYSLPIYLNR